jgi:flagellar basal-body rod modification protein FlgD
MEISDTLSQYSLDLATTSSENPDSILGKDDFMKLLLTELQYQDPTDPMDSDKILSQTSQLATLETQENTNKVMQEIAATFANTQNFQAVSAIGKTADLGSENITYNGDGEHAIDVYFPEAYQAASVTIKDLSGTVVDSFTLDAQSAANIQTIGWDGTYSSGGQVEAGEYRIEAAYVGLDGATYSAKFGVYPVSSVQFDGSDVKLKLGDNYVDMSVIKEIY